VRTLVGPDVLESLGTAFDDLAAATGSPVTARRPWLQTWVRCHPGWQPVAFEAGDGSGRLDGAVLLASRRRHGFVEVVALGHGPSDQARLPARSPEAADALAAAVARHLRGQPLPWRLRVAQLPVGDGVARRLAKRLPHAALIDAEDSPRIEFGAEQGLEAYTSCNTRKANRKALNRIAKAGLSASFDCLRGPREIHAVLPELERVRRARDAALRRPGGLDDEQTACFFRSILVEHAEHGEAEVTTLRLDGEVAAYVLAFLDGPSYRMWGTSVAPDWDHYSAGRLIVYHTIERALELGCDEYDYMRGLERYKLSNATSIVPAHTLVAYSSALVRSAFWTAERPRSLRRQLSAYKRRHPRVQQAWSAVKPLLSRR
jgi:CelD/BcsL family acetyltransferase involved in cellulose biosynthesis